MSTEHEKVDHALGDDCGKGWRSPEEYAALEAKCKELEESKCVFQQVECQLLNRAENAESKLAHSIPVEELIAWLKSEMLDDEGAMINARDHSEWDRYHRLEGHKDGLLHAIHHLRAHLESLRKAHQ